MPIQSIQPKETVTAPNNYIIEGGKEGKKRLDVMAEILNTDTLKLITGNEDLSGKSFLDLGCGGGNLALEVAGLVGENGHVTAIDFDAEIIRLAQADADRKAISNITFKAANAYEIDFNNEFDIVYSRFLLSHLQEPALVINKMLRALKPGGRIIIEDIDFSGHYCYPACEAFDLYVQYFTAAARNNEQDPHIGLSLFQLFQDAGVADIAFDVVQPSHNKGRGKWMAYFTMDKIKEAVIEQGLSTVKDIADILEKLADFTKDERSIISMPRIFRAWGKKDIA